MRHKNEWYTCDRCGIKIDSFAFRFAGIPFTRRIIERPSELLEKEYVRGGYVSKEKLEMPECLSIEISEYYDEKEKVIHLCGKCRKAFERFLRNEDGI